MIAHVIQCNFALKRENPLHSLVVKLVTFLTIFSNTKDGEGKLWVKCEGKAVGQVDSLLESLILVQKWIHFINQIDLLSLAHFFHYGSVKYLKFLTVSQFDYLKQIHFYNMSQRRELIRPIFFSHFTVSDSF